MPGELTGEVLLAAERAAHRMGHHVQVIEIGPQTARHRRRHIIRTLDRALDAELAPGLGHGNDHVGLEVRLLLVRRRVAALEHHVRRGERGVDVVVTEAPAREDVQPIGPATVPGDHLVESEQRGQRLHLDHDGAPRGLRLLEGGGRHQRDRLAEVEHLIPGEQRQVVGDHVDHARARDLVGGSEHDV